MEYIIIENQDEPTVGTDESGKAIIYSTLEEAQAACSNYQEPIVVPLEKNLFNILTNVANLLSMTLFELDDEDYESDPAEKELESLFG